MPTQRDIGPDLLRGLAILMVMATHMPYDHVPEIFEVGFARYGWFGVDIFFVLSGYLIGSELLRPVKAGHAPDFIVFYLKRAFRILPAFWFVLLIYTVCPGLREGPTMAPTWRFLTFTVNLDLDARIARSFSHAWSLCVEEHFYLILPIIVLVLRKIDRRWIPLVLVVSLVGGGMVLRDHLWQLAQSDGGSWADFLKRVYYPTWCRLDGLIAGASLAAMRLFHGDLWTRFVRPVFLVPVACLCITVAVSMTVSSGEILNETASVIVYPLFAFGVVMLLAAFVTLEPHLQALRFTGIGYIAAISYSLYLCEKLVFHADSLWLPEVWMQGWSAVAIYYLSGILVASAMYFVIERPFMRIRGHILTRMKKPPR